MNAVSYLGLVMSVNLACGIMTPEGDRILTTILDKIRDMEEDHLWFQTTLDTLEIENSKLVSRIEALQESDQKREAELNQIKSVGRPARRHDEFIGFLAYPSSSRDYESNQQVLFDLTSQNVGGHYNAGTSTFTCPTSGYYWFSVTVLSDKPCDLCEYDGMFGEIRISGNGIIRATAKGTNNNHQGSTSGIMYCPTGAQVNVYATTTSNINLRMIGSNESSFSGFLIWAEL